VDAGSDATTVLPSCSSGRTDGAETDIDCGGPTCAACTPGDTCAIGDDCASRVCDAGLRVCVAPSCTDGVKNGAETDVDCGGPSCVDCGLTKRCLAGTDCASARCSVNTTTAAAGYCIVATCVNGSRNGTETFIDCGGSSCAPCKIASSGCVVNSDCVSGVCAGTPSKSCAQPTCTDGVKNSGESDVDCGGGTCPTCADLKACTMPADCTSANCATYYSKLACLPAL
jgi:hypothetical protein